MPRSGVAQSGACKSCNSGVYLIQNTENHEVLYIGSTIDLRNRERQHRNPDFKCHGPFGRWLHANNLAWKVRVVVLEPMQHEDREQLKKLLRRQEFVWKQRLSSKFGQNDGLCQQPEEVQTAHKKKMRTQWFEQPGVMERQKDLGRKYFKNLSREKRDEINVAHKTRHRAKRLREDGVVVKTRVVGKTREEKLAANREWYRKKQLKLGIVVKPRGRINRAGPTNEERLATIRGYHRKRNNVDPKNYRK